MNRKFVFSIGEFYHLYNRGNGRKGIFLKPNDHDRFVRLLFLCNSINPVSVKDTKNLSFTQVDRGETLIDIGAYCLMPNHFHILAREKCDGGISLFMKKLLTGYSMYFNMKYERTGKLFEGAFKATHIDSDEYLKYLFAYIHLNPVKLFEKHWKEYGIGDRLGAKHYLEQYTHSSYSDYLGSKREEGYILNQQAFPEYFSETATFEAFVDDWLQFLDLTEVSPQGGRETA